MNSRTKRNLVRFTKVQREWAKNYESVTTFEPLLDDFLYGNESFVEAAKKSIRWFEDWSHESMLRIDQIPGTE